jgi:hypothetical protein
VPLAPVPSILLPRHVRQTDLPNRTAVKIERTGQFAPYFLGALTLAAKRIREAPAGAQEATINGESFSIGSLVAAGAGSAHVARSVLLGAASSVALDPARPWGRGGT